MLIASEARRRPVKPNESDSSTAEHEQQPDERWPLAVSELGLTEEEMQDIFGRC